MAAAEDTATPPPPWSRPCRSPSSSRARSRWTGCRRQARSLQSAGDGRGVRGARRPVRSRRGLDRLEGEVRVQPVDTGRTFLVSGRVLADVVQTCVVTQEPVPARVEGEFDRLFSREVPAEAEGEVEIDPEAELPEPLADNRLDLGEILAEELSLALDPYPRSPDADRYLAETRSRGRRQAESRALAPFGALARTCDRH